MCGIAGLIHFDGTSPDPADLGRMAAAMAHRGPDDAGVYVSGPVGFAFRRLAILDLSSDGHQPMLTPDGRHAIVFNGEIYDHGALRRGLERDGRAPDGGWRSRTDTETLLQACVARGAAAACRAANGMFAFAWWDATARRVTLARDRFGKKPLFIAREPGRLAFASELRALLAVAPAGARAAVDRRRLAAFLCYRFSPGHETLLAGVEPLAPGHVLEIPVDRGPPTPDDMTPRAFYDFDFSRGPERGFGGGPEGDPAGDLAGDLRGVSRASLEGDGEGAHPARGCPRPPAPAPGRPRAALSGEAALVEETHDLLEDAVRLRLLSDVPFGAFLSGGLDSSLVVALMARLHPEPVKTYSVGFDTGFSEAGHAARVARHLGTDHHELTVGAEALVRAIPAALWSRETPISEPSDVPIYLLSRLAREKVTVVLSGEGADEAFAGYPKYAAMGAAASPLARAVLGLPGVRPLLGAAARGLPAALRRAQTALEAFSVPDRWEHHALWFGAFGAAERRALLAPGLYTEAEAHVHRAARRLLAGREAPSDAFPSTVEEALYLDTRLWLPSNLLLRGDRMTMAHSLELRCPFLDWRLVEFAARRLPRSLKLRGREGKRVLKLVAERRVGLPAAIVRRPKWGFKVPVGAWFRGRVLGPSLRAVLFSADALDRGWYQEAALRRLVDDHAGGRADHGRKLWLLYQLELWQRMFIDGTLKPGDELL